jgi:hypothetical protein
MPLAGKGRALGADGGTPSPYPTKLTNFTVAMRFSPLSHAAQTFVSRSFASASRPHRRIRCSLCVPLAGDTDNIPTFQEPQMNAARQMRRQCASGLIRSGWKSMSGTALPQAIEL